MSLNKAMGRSGSGAPAAPPRRSSAKYPVSRQQQQRQQDLLLPQQSTSLGGAGVQLSMNDLTRITNPSLPQSSARAPAPPAVSRDAYRALHEITVKHDALMIVEQKAPNVLRLPDKDSNINRIINSDMRHEALRTLPLAFPPVRFRRGETIDEYIESVTKPWDDVRKHSATSFIARRMSASGVRTLVEDIALSAQAQKSEALRQRHNHLVSIMWRQTHAAKADIIVSEETSSSLLRPLLERATQRAIEVEQQMVAAVAESCREGISATPRGLVVPYQYYAHLVNAIHGAMDEAFTSFFQLAQDEQTRQTRADEDAASSSLRHLIKGSSAVKHVEVELPPPGHPSRHSLLTVKTAVNVSIMWRMLEQVQSIVPGMDTALALFHELLPLIYVDFAQVRPLIANVSCLGEQIKQLCAIPLISVELQRTAANEEQFRNDADYLRMAMENWSFNIWRNYNSIERRRAKHLDALNQLFERYEKRRSVSAVFNEWRLHVMQEKTNIAMQAMKSKYDAFVATARHAAAESIPMSTNRAIAANQARFIAQRLASTAVHEKPNSRQSAGLQQSLSPSSATTKQLKPQTTQLATVDGTVSPVETSPVLRSRAVVSFSPTKQTPPDGALAESSVQGVDNADAPSAIGERRHFFDEVIVKLQSVEDVSGHLREFIAMQRKAIDKLEVDRRKLAEALEQSRGDAIQLLEEKLKLHNTVQERDLRIRDQLKQIIRLKAKVRLHRHKHWRSASMRVLSDTLGLSNADVERADQARAATESSSMANSHQLPVVANNTIHALALHDGDDEDGGDASETEKADPEFSSKHEGPTEQERIFGRIAPIVLDAPTQLPDALVILKDWGNNCLEDLQALDGVGGASSLSSRLSSMSNELRDGIIISRLLFYLALPRYRPAPRKNEELEDVSPDFNINRQRLLRLQGVQLHSPFPTYDDCFGDLMRFPAVKRMNILLNFASDLISGTLRLSTEQLDAIQALQAVSDRFAEQDSEKQQKQHDEGDGNAQEGNSVSANASGLGQKKRSTNRILLDFSDGVPTKGRKVSTAFSDGGSFPTSSEFLPQYIDPLMLCEGSRSAAVTLLAMLYVRFAHAFNHKANETSAKESELLKALMRDQSSLVVTSAHNRSVSPATRRLEDLLGTIEEEEKSPWQIFLDRCKPMFTTSAHPFVLEGNFWSASMCESAEMLQVFSAVTCALRRSLDVHRWHVTMMCLTPMISSFGMTRGCFCGTMASTSMYLFQRSCETTDVRFYPELVYQLAVQRKEWKGGNTTGKTTSLSTTPQTVSLVASFFDGADPQTKPSCQDSFIQLEGGAEQYTAPSGSTPDDSFANTAYYIDLARTLESFTADLARVFLSRSCVSATLLVPSMTLTAWRTLWLDIGICPEKISIEILTSLFADACRPPYGGAPGMLDPQNDSNTSDPRSYSMTGGGGISNALQEMTFDEFCEGCLRIAHHRYAPVTIVSGAGAGAGGGAPASPGPSSLFEVNAPPPLPAFHTVSPRGASANPPKRKVLTSLRDAFVRLLTEAILPLNPLHAPPSAMQQLKQGVLVQDLLRRKNGEMLSIFQAYAKVYLGVAGLEKEDVLRMVKDAGLATAELSYQVVADLFVECSLKRTQADQVLMNTMDPNHADGAAPSSRHGSIFAGHGSSIVGGGSFYGAGGAGGGPRVTSVPRHQMSLMQQATMDRQILDFPSFVDFLCVLMVYKLPNPFVPMHARLENFLDRSLIAPLRFRVEQVARAKARNKDGRGKEAPSSAQQSIQPQPLAPPTRGA